MTTLCSHPSTPVLLSITSSLDLTIAGALLGRSKAFVQPDLLYICVVQWQSRSHRSSFRAGRYIHFKCVITSECSTCGMLHAPAYWYPHGSI
ncbi:hypothetical protein A0H81_11559 [Grifola frondosa]|uniref:Uncharacterized protein n=1 Tax=Grifola frondosa TaxID=5627 RepID=A0A1C7M0H5_GRIFR|nr:hypothetical protein A0H81_11559 [Grifola frondosa]